MLVRIPTLVLSVFLGLQALSAPAVQAIGNAASISETDLSEALKVVREKRPELAKDLTRTKLRTLLTDPGSGIRLVDKPPAVPTQAINTEKLPRGSGVGYVRIASLSADLDWAELERQLAQWSKTGAMGLVLDLRDSADFANYSNTVRLVSLLAPERTERIDAPMIVLVSARTAGVAEVLADSLRRSAKAIVLGESTAGERIMAQDFPLPSGKHLRLASQQTAPGVEKLETHEPVKPDILLADVGVAPAPELVASALQERPPRPRLSEAALVRNENPETDNWLDASQGPNQNTKKEPSKNPSSKQDKALVMACDIVQSAWALRQPPAIVPTATPPAPPQQSQR